MAHDRAAGDSSKLNRYFNSNKRAPIFNHISSKWTIASKIRIILALAFVAGGFLYFEVLHRVIYPSYIQMEHQQAVANIERVIFALDRVNHLTHVRFTLRSKTFRPESCDYLPTTRHTFQTGSYCIENHSTDDIRIFSDYPTIAGGTAFVIQAELPRAIYREAKKVMGYSAFALLLSLIIIIALISLLLKKLINTPISDLKAHILNIKRLGDLENRFPLECDPCNDEILVLAKEFNGMLDRLSTMSNRLKRANAKLEKLTKTDPLSHIANRRMFDDHFKKQWRLMQRLGKPISLIICDVDFFKLYNDYYGHQSGDECLARVAQAPQSKVHRTCNLVARYGGEEFVAVLPATELQGSVSLAEVLRQHVESLKIPHSKSSTGSWVTLSLGVSSLVPHDENSADDLMELTDQALYQAKAHGRNRWHALSTKVLDTVDVHGDTT